jgi:hypothetical protein
MISLSLGLDIILVVLLLVTIIYALVLSRRLSVLRSSKTDLEDFIKRMNEASARAEASLTGLKQTAGATKAELDQPLAKAQSLRDELMFLIDRADAAGERLANASSTGATSGGASAATGAAGRKAPRAATQPNPNAGGGGMRDAGSDDDGDSPRSKAERDLMNALKNAR